MNDQDCFVDEQPMLFMDKTISQLALFNLATTVLALVKGFGSYI